MGSRGPLPKPADRAQGHRKRGTVVALPAPTGLAYEPPRPPPNLLKATRDAWDAYWRSDVAGLTQEVDLPALRRLFRIYDQFDRAMAIVQKAMAVKGSTGQIRVNPLADYAAKLDTQALRLENELGLTPLARQRLSSAVGEAVLTLAEINAMAQEGDDDDADFDPRVLDIEATTA